MRHLATFLILSWTFAANALEVGISLAADPQLKASFVAATNLPDGMELLVTVFRKDLNYFAQTKTKVSNGHFSFGPFSMHGESLTPGWYDLRIDSPISSIQSKSVQAVIGNDGQYMTGNFVKPSPIGGNVIELVGNFEMTANSESPANGSRSGSKQFPQRAVDATSSSRPALPPVENSSVPKGIVDRLSECLLPKAQYGQYSSYDGGKSAISLMKDCPKESLNYIDACRKTGKDSGQCNLEVGILAQMALKLFNK